MMSLRFYHVVFFIATGLYSSSAVGQITTTFSYSGEVESYIVPSCVYQLNVVIKGGEGGGPNGGGGATVSGILDVIEGQVIEIRVGNSGGCPNGGYNGGGDGANANNNANGGCGGGGGSDIRFAPFDLADRVAVAGGGGGMGGGNTDAFGGGGGCISGSIGESPFGDGGNGGTTNSGGNGGPPWITSGNQGGNGFIAQGGSGAIDPCYNVGPGGGGGGGLYGGGGGGSDCFASGTLGGGGGGGGSSLTPAGFTCVAGNVSSAGSISITPVGGLALQVTPADPLYCQGDSMFLTMEGADVYSWSPGYGIDTLSGPEVWATPDTTTVYSVIGSTEECTDTIDIQVTVVPYPIMTLTASDSISCNDDPVTLNVSGADQFSWSPIESLSNGYGPVNTATPTETTTYTVTGTTSGCSSDTSITIAYQINAESTEFFCENGTYQMPDGSEVNEEGTYVAQYVSLAGCDSIVTLNLLEQSTYDFQMPIALCAGETFMLPDGVEVDSPGTYPVVMQTANAQCDSSITTVVSILQPATVQIALGLCEGEPVELADGTIVSEEGTYTVVLTAQNGCDSTITAEVSIAPSYDLDVALSACDDGSYLFPDGSLPTSSGSFDFGLQTALGCDSSVTIDLQLNQAYNLAYPAEICDGEVFNMPDGVNIGTEGDYVSLLQTTAGCDSIVTVQLVVQPLPDVALGAADSYCLYDGNIPLNPAPDGGTLSGDLLNGSELVHEGATPGDYEVSYSYTDANGCTYTELQPYVLATPLEPTFDFQLICNELQLQSTTLDPNTDHEYAWFLDNEAIAIFAEPVFYFDQTGTFDLGLTVTDIYGCSYSTNESVVLQNALDLTGFFVPNVITPNGDDYNDRFELPAAVASCLYYTIDIYNRWGQLVYTMTPETAGFSGRKQDGSEVPDGVYYYTLEIQNYPCLETPGLTEWCAGTLSIFRD